MLQKQAINHSARRLTLFCCAVVLLGGFTYWQNKRSQPYNAQSAMQANPGLVCTDAEHDFGRVNATEALLLQHQFTITNTSPKPIRIVKTESTCGCTKAEVSPDPIAPGASVTVRVEASWPGRHGRQTVEAILHTDRAEDDTLVLSLQGYVLIPAIFSPQIANFGVMKPREKRTITVELTPGTDPIPFTVRQITVSKPFIQVERLTAAPTTQPGMGKYTVTLEAPPEGAWVKEEVTFLTTLPSEPERKLIVTADCRPVISLVPESLFFTAMVGHAQEQRVLVTFWADSAIPTAQVSTGKTGKPGVFRVVRVAPVVHGADHSYEAIVGFAPSEATSDLSRALLHVAVGKQTTDVALIGRTLDEN